MQEVISASWHGYSRDWVAGQNPSHVICIGKGVLKVVKDDDIEIVGNDNVKVIPRSCITSDPYQCGMVLDKSTGVVSILANYENGKFTTLFSKIIDPD